MEHSANPHREAWAIWDEDLGDWVWNHKPFLHLPRERQVRYELIGNSPESA